jgi:hypothetical protein
VQRDLADHLAVELGDPRSEGARGGEERPEVVGPPRGIPVVLVNQVRELLTPVQVTVHPRSHTHPESIAAAIPARSRVLSERSSSVADVGSAGMKRKGRRHLPKVGGDIGAEDTARLFGRFRWNQYSPAGSVERAGFFARQAGRTGTDLGRQWGFGIVRLLLPLALGVAVVALVWRLLT